MCGEPTEAAMFPINTLLALARQRMNDANWEREDARQACQQTADAMENEAREFLTTAKAQGWDGNVEGFINDAR